MRVVFDTNTVISALLFRGSASWLVEHWRSRDITFLVSQTTAGELLRVLHYPKFGLSSQQIETAISFYLPYAERVEVLPGLKDLPQCRDAQDQMFIELAHCGRADVLVSGDADLLILRQRTIFTIETLAEYSRRIRGA